MTRICDGIGSDECPWFAPQWGEHPPGCYEGRDVTILDAYDAQAAADVGEIPHAKAADAIIRAACPGAGGCGIAASFNTWGITMEAIGLMPPFSSSIPAIDPAKKQECLEVGHLLTIAGNRHPTSRYPQPQGL